MIRRLAESRGFSLVELLVVLAIIGTIMAVVFASQGSFNKTIVLSNTAYDVALTIRSAEVYGISSRAVGAVSNAGYGAHFSRGTPNSFIFFADTSPVLCSGSSTPDCKPGDHLYTSGSDTVVQSYTLGNNISLDYFCAWSISRWMCSVSELNNLDISFSRPNPDAFIYSDGTRYTRACLAFTSLQGEHKYVSVESSGEITANAVSCPPSS